MFYYTKAGNFFDRVNHGVLMRLLRRRISDRRVLRLISSYLRAGVQLENGTVEPTLAGVPQGGPLSPVLANIMLDELDRELEKRGHRFVRYADDFIIMTKSPRAAQRVFKSITRWLEKRLKLTVNASKSRVCAVAEVEFLGFCLRRKKITVSAKSVAAFGHRVRELTGRSWGVSMEYRMGRLASYLRGWMRYFSIGVQWQQVVKWEGWIRRRLRMCWWKRWRKTRCRVRELMKLGCDEHRAVTAAMSRKSFWRLSKTYATQLGMTNAWLEEQGLVAIRDVWIAVHYPKDKAKAPADPGRADLWT